MKKHSNLDRSLARMDENMEWDPRRKQRVERLIKNQLHEPYFKDKSIRSFHPKSLVSVSTIILFGILTILFSNLLSGSFQQERSGSIFQELGNDSFKQYVEDGNVREVDLTFEDERYKTTISEAYYNHTQLAISYRIEAFGKENQDLESLILNKSPFRMFIDGQKWFLPTIGPYNLQEDGKVLEGILSVEGTNDFQDSISVGIEFKEIGENHSFLFDIEKINSYNESNATPKNVLKKFTNTDESLLTDIFTIPVEFNDGGMGRYFLIGEKEKVAFQIASGLEDESVTIDQIRANEPNKYMWYVWGENLANASFEVIGTNINKNHQSHVIEERTLTFGTGMNGSDATIPTTMSFPTSGVWKLDVYVDSMLYSSIFIEVL
ncbi:DUF4871 domain-containing protein [Halalkalibacter akibai]|uniref:DUF4179 domain-containing protein n=1 Tax=Halalkalibacter akibai (strain ATCC 43226 / DSM 21942 / CIP 109018 / JCM 9157 / 1139) TaxID=1236973 RepID=W4QZE7_HALA3|nr:DUF4871 domain-containing protein [Halalkalibacter akibai]GAE37436.1 hypothetical protein JCM9157_4736 [Halalkalibacter akibai JCM 9157]